MQTAFSLIKKSQKTNSLTDENIYEQLAFSETLVISELHDTNDSELKEPVPVGGLSLNIQSVQGLSRHRQEKHFPDAEVSDGNTSSLLNHYKCTVNVI